MLQFFKSLQDSIGVAGVATIVAIVVCIVLFLVGRVVWSSFASDGGSKRTDLSIDTLGFLVEKRRTKRRRARDVGVLVATAGGREKPVKGIVHDLSVGGGLGILVGKEHPVGARVVIQPTDAPTTTEGADGTVKSCRRFEDGWLLGIEFLKPPSATTMLYFG